MSSGMPQLDFTWYPTQIFWLVVTFGVLYFVMSRYIIPHIHMVLESRQQRLDYDLDRAESLRAEAEEARETYEHALADARNQAQKLLNDVSDAIRKTSDEKHRELDQILYEKIVESENQIDNARKEADRQLEPTAANVACHIFQSLVEAECDPDAMLDVISAQNRKAA